jgi:tRNA-Thr(GGU) m(6)t(6)A37 methyltransferase TsaA
MTILGRLRSLLPRRHHPLVPDDPVSYAPIGIVRNRVKSSRPDGWQSVSSDIFVSPEYETALDGLQEFSHILVVFDMAKVPEGERRLRLQAGSDGGERGVLATRSQRRPNAIGVSAVRLLHRRHGVLRVRGLDAIDGTLVLDLKPYLPAYDSVPDAKLPSWALPADE